MIENKFEEAFTPEWVEANISDPANELVVLGTADKAVSLMG